ncbi:hypothetical protein HBA55_09550 [Pseudomaricurvus alkylphenolicus]|jgi:hypothetical protein|uniref:hypothetical protein n=1 Tax=Pseudomaricurvus alkylphenolicus TaxID=1306991 RepID=UPI001420F3CF|nr:hypothetical protein [Pseudomaricurvus alkylphenolicus]NIB39829.1 hypothetical protein [Pseudomaricurvus alkylphenolicus]
MNKPCSFWHAALLAALLSSTLPVIAQDADSGESKDASKPEQSQQDQQEDTEPVPGRNERFVPTEEISEDLSVSFPVDI